MTEILALIAGFLIVVAGWFATGVLNRRSVRRATRIDYLLSAYRRLDAATERPMDAACEADLESAIADIQLLGTQKQVGMADQFARDFASDRSAEVGSLLEDLRRALRGELLLDRVPDRKVRLRITNDGDLWARQTSIVQARLRGDVPADRVLELVGVSSDAARRIARSHQRLLDDLASCVSEGVEVEPEQDLVRLAVERHAISPGTAEAIEGLTVMRNLAMIGRRQATGDDAAEFEALVDGVRFAVQREAAASKQDGPIAHEGLGSK